MVKHRDDIEKQQRLYELLKEQHEAEKHEILHYSSLLKDIQNSLIRNYINTLLNDGIKHIQYITQAMAKIEGASGSLHLTKEGMNKSIEDSDIKELLKSIVVDEEHHIKILQHIRHIVETYSKKIQQ